MPNHSSTDRWIGWLRTLQSIAQIGLTYSKGAYDLERYRQLQGLTAEMAAHLADDEPPRLTRLFAQENGYATPKIDVRGAVFRDDKILLVREVQDEGRWTLPGGWADVGDSPKTAVVKEVFEESGFDVQVVKLIAMLDREQHPHPKMYTHIYKLFFLCEIVGGEAKTSLETSEIGFFAEHDIPQDLSTARVLPSQIALCFAHYREPKRPSVID